MAKYTSIGGQALIEGILMKSPEKTALCVRLPDGSIDTSYMEEKRLTKNSQGFLDIKWVLRNHILMS